MPRIAIQLPAVEVEDRVEVELTVNGEKRKFQYRVELFAWDEYIGPDEPRVNCLKQVLREYDRDWDIVEISEASEREFAVLFRRKDPEHRPLRMAVSESVGA